MTTRRTAIWAILAFACSGAFAQEYEIRMDRPSRVGQRYELTASGSMSQNTTLSSQGQVISENKSSFTAELKGTVTVLQINERKQESKIKLTVSECLMSTNGDPKEKETLAKGTQVVAQLRDGKQVFLIDGKPGSAQINAMLGLFISLSKREASDDDVFGTKDRKKVGDSWPVNSTLAAKDLLKEGIQVKPENIKGSTKLDKVVVIDGTKCLQISAKMEASNVVLPAFQGVAVGESTFSAAFSGGFPIDVTMGLLSDTMKMTMVLVAKGRANPDAAEVTWSMTVKKSRSMQMKRKLRK